MSERAAIRFYRDERGRPRVASDDERFDVLRTFLEVDVGGWEDTLRDAMRRAGSGEQVELIGNVHTVTLTSESATIEFDYGGAPVEVPLREFERVVEEWVSFYRPP